MRPTGKPRTSAASHGLSSISSAAARARSGNAELRAESALIQTMDIPALTWVGALTGAAVGPDSYGVNQAAPTNHLANNNPKLGVCAKQTNPHTEAVFGFRPVKQSEYPPVILFCNVQI